MEKWDVVEKDCHSMNIYVYIYIYVCMYLSQNATVCTQVGDMYIKRLNIVHFRVYHHFRKGIHLANKLKTHMTFIL